MPRLLLCCWKTERGSCTLLQMLEQAIHELAHAWGEPRASGRLRCTPEDFQVTEIPLLEPDGAGEHVWLWVRKCNANTPWVAEQLMRNGGREAWERAQRLCP